MAQIASMLSLFGAGAGGLSSLLGAQDQNRNYDDAVEEQTKRSAYQEHLRGQQLYGPAYTRYAAKLYQALTQAQSGDTSALDTLSSSPEYAAYSQATGGPLVNQYRSLGDKVIGKQNANLASYDADTARLGGMDDAYTRRLDDMSAGLEGIARRYGSGRRKEIAGNYTADLNNADDATRASLAAAGLSNSSAVANQMSGNRASLGRARESAINDVADRQSNLMMQAGTTRLNTAASAGGSAIQHAYGRAGDRQGILQSNLQRIIAMRTAPLELMNNAQTYQPQGVMSPNTSPSGSTALLSSLGSSASTFGGYLTGQNNMADLLKQLQGLRTAA
jgi:hypothetical protein